MCEKPNDTDNYGWTHDAMNRVANVIADIQLGFEGWYIAKPQMSRIGYVYTQVVYDGSGHFGSEPWTGARILLHPRMTNTEIVNAALKGYLGALKHEALEQFFYRGIDIKSPHLNVDTLARLMEAREHNDPTIYDVRSDALDAHPED